MNLQQAIEQKQYEANLRGIDLTYRDYEGREWAQMEIILLNKEIAIIKSYWPGDTELNLPRCCHGELQYCLIAHSKLDCWLRPRSCGFSYKVEARQEKPQQEAMI